VDGDGLIQAGELEDLAVVLGEPYASSDCFWRLARTSIVTTMPIPPLFMYSRPLKLSRIEVAPSAVSLSWASVSTPSQVEVTSPVMSMTPARSSTVRACMETGAAGIGTAPSGVMQRRWEVYAPAGLPVAASRSLYICM
jgi:hypothetical protein